MQGSLTTKAHQRLRLWCRPQPRRRSGWTLMRQVYAAVILACGTYMVCAIGGAVVREAGWSHAVFNEPAGATAGKVAPAWRRTQPSAEPVLGQALSGTQRGDAKHAAPDMRRCARGVLAARQPVTCCETDFQCGGGRSVECARCASRTCCHVCGGDCRVHDLSMSWYQVELFAACAAMAIHLAFAAG